jgi:hypothetical protein
LSGFGMTIDQGRPLNFVLQLTAPWRFDPSPYSNTVEAGTLAVSVPTEASAFDPSPYSFFSCLFLRLPFVYTKGFFLFNPFHLFIILVYGFQFVH